VSNAIQNRVAVVTGAARGIGRATAERLVADGHAVAIVDIDGASAETTAAELRANGASARGYAADVADEVAVATLFDDVVSDMGIPTILVNNAGIIRDNLLFKMSFDDWDAVMSVHLRGMFLMSKFAQAHMVEQGWGRIINISSSSALGNRGQANYSTAKAGVQGFTKTLALELGAFGITANAVAPGFIETDMNRAVAQRLGIDWEQYRTEFARTIPVRRGGQAEDVAHAVSFFAGPDSGFISGQVLYVAGGPLA
jgi:3-oxoacyl-[acyl-carrier protein] reductase